MREMLLGLFDLADILPKLELQGATWKHRLVKSPEGETKVLLYDILTADNLMQMNLDAMSDEELRALLPHIVDLYDNIDATEPDDYELSEEECEKILLDLEEKATEVETILRVVCSRLGMAKPE